MEEKEERAETAAMEDMAREELPHHMQITVKRRMEKMEAKAATVVTQL
jgi:hypothetical protein